MTLTGVKKIADIYQKLRPNVGTLALFNANGYTLSMLAKGEIAGYIHFSSKVWEAAGLLIAKEAGARITDFKNAELNLDFRSSKGFSFVITNGLIHDALLSATV